jgi:hypothetical protein
MKHTILHKEINLNDKEEKIVNTILSNVVNSSNILSGLELLLEVSMHTPIYEPIVIPTVYPYSIAYLENEIHVFGFEITRPILILKLLEKSLVE